MLYHHPTQICDLFCKNMPEVSEATIEIRQKVRLKYFSKAMYLSFTLQNFKAFGCDHSSGELLKKKPPFVAKHEK